MFGAFENFLPGTYDDNDREDTTKMKMNGGETEDVQTKNGQTGKKIYTW